MLRSQFLYFLNGVLKGNRYEAKKKNLIEPKVHEHVHNTLPMVRTVSQQISSTISSTISVVFNPCNINILAIIVLILPCNEIIHTLVKQVWAELHSTENIHTCVAGPSKEALL